MSLSNNIDTYSYIIDGGMLLHRVKWQISENVLQYLIIMLDISEVIMVIMLPLFLMAL